MAEISEPSPIFIDIPIGLRETAPEARLCDQEARQVLKPHRTSSVFNAPIRDILAESTFASANGLSKQLINKGISQQTFNIMAKIREVDTLLHENPNAKQLIREVHPEVCFWALANGQAMASSKKTEAGFNERLQLIERFYPSASRAVFAAIKQYPRSVVARDDILDAVVAAITAAHSARWATLPEQPELDSHGLPMEIVYLK
jgi:predicted RNase H-like nuclease